MAWEWRSSGNLTYLTIPEWERMGIDVGFSTRPGGESSFPYNGLNLGLHVGDDPEAVLKNRRHWLEDLWGVSWPEVVVGEQIHGNQVRWVNEEDGGRGAKELQTAIPGTDGLVTQSAIGLLAFFADCVPLYFYYPDLGAVGIAHSGWQGTVKKIAQRVIDVFEEAGGCTEKAWVAVGPSIGPCCYVVDERVAGQFRANYDQTPFLFPQADVHYFLDLWEANRVLFLEKGIPPENIAVAAVCTADHPEWFFSHRRDGARTGRMAGWIRAGKLK